MALHIASPGEAQGKRLKFSWKARVKAWWNGYDLNALRMSDSGSEAINADEGPPPLWEATRIDILEKVWGEGFHTPADENHIATLIKPFGLNESMSVLELGSGLGGLARQITKSTGAYVTGLEADPELAAAGMERSHKAGLDKRAPISEYDPEHLATDKRFDAILAKEAFFTIRDKGQILDGIVNSLKPGGQFAFTDYVLKHSASTGQTIDEWRQSEVPKVHPWTIAQTQEALAERTFDIRISEDLSDVHRTLILAAWDRMTAELPSLHATEQSKEKLMAEGEIWLRRVAALDSGDLRLYRFYALLKG
ncbi:MAG: class I SAM-dependent methyltransferase [Inquilinaceae bacterium]